MTGKMEDNKYALAIKKDLLKDTSLIPLSTREINLSQTDLIIIQKHLQGWTAKRIASELGHTIQNVHRVLRKPDALQLIAKNRDYVYDELQALGEQVIGVLRDGLTSTSESTRIKCALGLVGRLAKPKGENSVDDKMTATQFLQQININNLQVVNEKKDTTEGQDSGKVIDHAGTDAGDG